jgi:hypothetical protein
MQKKSIRQKPPCISLKGAKGGFLYSVIKFFWLNNYEAQLFLEHYQHFLEDQENEQKRKALKDQLIPILCEEEKSDTLNPYYYTEVKKPA